MHIWFQDEARFGQQGTIARVWAPRGSRPRAVRQQRYEYLYVLGAACPATGETCGLLSPDLNTGVINIYLQQFSEQLADDVHAVMIWDQAGFHTAGDLVVPANVSLIELPPRAPELNPIENLWHYLRDHYWANRAYADYAALEHAACAAWRDACLDPALIRTVCHAPYMERHN